LLVDRMQPSGHFGPDVMRQREAEELLKQLEEEFGEEVGV